MPQSPISVAGKTVLAVAGFVWGLYRSMETSRPQLIETREKGPLAGTPAIDELDRRLNRMEAALARLASIERSATVAGRETPLSYVTQEELKDLLERAEKHMEGHVAEQFGNQKLAIDSLRAMIIDTDILLERVLSRLDAISRDDTSDDYTEAERASAQPDRESAREIPTRENPAGAGKRPVSTSVG